MHVAPVAPVAVPILFTIHINSESEEDEFQNTFKSAVYGRRERDTFKRGRHSTNMWECSVHLEKLKDI